MLNDNGIIFRGVEKHIQAQGWNFGQVSRGTGRGLGHAKSQPRSLSVCSLLPSRDKLSDP